MPVITTLDGGHILRRTNKAARSKPLPAHDSAGFSCDEGIEYTDDKGVLGVRFHPKKRRPFRDRLRFRTSSLDSGEREAQDEQRSGQHCRAEDAIEPGRRQRGVFSFWVRVGEHALPSQAVLALDKKPRHVAARRG